MWMNQLLRKDINKFHLNIPLYSKLDSRCLCLSSLNNSSWPSETQQSTSSPSSSSSSSSSSASTTANLLENNPHYLKYSDKIKQALQKQTVSCNNLKINQALNNDGHSSFISSSIQDSSNVKPSNEAAKPKVTKQFSDQTHSKYNPSLNLHKPNLTGQVKRLNDLVHLDLLKQRSSKEIAQIWQNYHKSKENYICAVISSSKYNHIKTNGQKYPVFIYPLPKKEAATSQLGYMFILGQFDHKNIYFTLLTMYQLHHENAPAILSIQHFEELEKEKEIILMQGYFDSNHLSAMEAQCLINQLQIYYLCDDPRKTKLLEKLNYNPEKFDYKEVIENFEKGLV